MPPRQKKPVVDIVDWDQVSMVYSLGSAVLECAEQVKKGIVREASFPIKLPRGFPTRPDIHGLNAAQGYLTVTVKR